VSSPASAVAVRLKAVAAVTALCQADNIVWGWGQAEEVLPHIECFEIDRADMAAQTSGPQRSVVRVDIAAAGAGSLALVNALADAIEAALLGVGWEHAGWHFAVPARTVRQELPGNPIDRVQVGFDIIATS
jgi:hypothetical protein